MRTIVVTRHPALITFLEMCGHLPESYSIIDNIMDPEVVRGCRVIGTDIPLKIAAIAATVTEVTLDIPPVLSGQELTVDQIGRYIYNVGSYKTIAL